MPTWKIQRANTFTLVLLGFSSFPPSPHSFTMSIRFSILQAFSPVTLSSLTSFSFSSLSPPFSYACPHLLNNDPDPAVGVYLFFHLSPAWLLLWETCQFTTGHPYYLLSLRCKNKMKHTGPLKTSN